MNHTAIIAVVKDRRQDKYRIHHLVEAVFSAHQINQSLRIVEDRPSVMPAIAFRKGIPPLQRIERRLELTIFILATHQFMFGIIQILIVHGPLGEDLYFLFRLVQSFTQLIDTPVIVSVLQRTGCILIDTYVIRNIAQFIVIVISETSGRRHLRMYCVSSVLHSFPQRFDIISFQTFQISIGNYGSRIITHHTASVSRACPLRQEAAFLVGIDQSFLHLRVHRRIHQVQEREKATESIPETGVGKHITGKYFAIIRAVMNDITFRIYFVEASGEKYRTIQAGVESTQMVDIVIFHFDASQNIIPHFTSLGCNLVYITAASSLFVSILPLATAAV